MFHILLVCCCFEKEWRTESEKDLLIADVSHSGHKHGSELFSSRCRERTILAVLLRFCCYFAQSLVYFYRLK